MSINASINYNIRTSLRATSLEEWAWRQRVDTPAQRLILQYLVFKHRNPNGTAFPTRGAIIAAVGMECEKVTRAIRRMEQWGIVREHQTDRFGIADKVISHYKDLEK